MLRIEIRTAIEFSPRASSLSHAFATAIRAMRGGRFTSASSNN